MGFLIPSITALGQQLAASVVADISQYNYCIIGTVWNTVIYAKQNPNYFCMKSILISIHIKDLHIWIWTIRWAWLLVSFTWKVVCKVFVKKLWGDYLSSWVFFILSMCFIPLAHDKSECVPKLLQMIYCRLCTSLNWNPCHVGSSLWIWHLLATNPKMLTF